MDSTTLCTDTAIVKRKTGFFGSTKEKNRRLELHMISGGQQVYLKSLKLRAKGDESFILPVTADSILKTGLPNESPLSLSLPTSARDEDAAIFIFEEEETFHAWRMTLETCIACLKANGFITDDLYLHHLDLAEKAAAEAAKAKAEDERLARLKSLKYSPPKPEKPPRVLSKPKSGKKEVGASSPVPTSADIQADPTSFPTPLPSRPALVDAAATPQRPQGAVGQNTMDAPSTKPKASSARPWLVTQQQEKLGLAPTPQRRINPEAQVTLIAPEGSVEPAAAESELDDDRATADEPPPPPPPAPASGSTSDPGPGPASPSSAPALSVNKAAPDAASPPERKADRVLQSYSIANAVPVGFRSLELNYSASASAPLRAALPSAHSDFIYAREVQALTQLNSQLNEALDRTEEQRVQEQDRVMQQLAEMQSNLDASKVVVDLLSQEKASLQTDLDATNEALHAMALMKDEHESNAARQTKEVERLQEYVRDIEGRAERGDDSVIIVSLREAAKTARERCAALETDLTSKAAELAAASVAASKATDELRSVRAELQVKAEGCAKLQETTDALLAQLSLQREEIARLNTARDEEQARGQRDLERLRAQLEAERSERLAEAEDVKSSERKNKKTISMYEVLTADQQAKIKALSEALDSFVETKKELATYVSNSDALTRAAQTSSEVCQKLERELSSAAQQISTLEADKATTAAETRAALSKAAEEIEDLKTAKRHAQSERVQAAADKGVMQLRLDALVEKCAILEKEVAAEQDARAKDAREHLREMQEAQDKHDSLTRVQREALNKVQLSEQGLMGTCEKLRRSLGEAEDSLEEKARQLASAVAKISALDSGVQARASNEAELERQLKSAERRFEAKAAVHEEKERSLEGASQALGLRLEQLAQELEAVGRKRDELNQALRAAQSDARAREHDANEAKRDVADLKQRLEAANDACLSATKSLDSRNNDIEVLRRQYEALLDAKAGLDNTLKDRNTEVSNLTVAVAAAKSKEATIESLLAQMKTLDTVLAAKTAEAAEKDREVAALQETLHTLEVAAAAAPAEIASLKTQITSQRERLQAGADQLGVLRSSLQIIERERDELSSECAELRGVTAELRGANALLQLQIDSNRRELASLKANIDRHEAAQPAIEAERVGLLDSLRQSEERCSSLRDLFAKVSERLENSERRVRVLDQDVADRQRSVETLERERTQLAAQLEHASERLRSMITMEEANALTDRLTGLWGSEKEALQQRAQGLAVRLETERAANARCREELSVALRGLVASPTTSGVAAVQPPQRQENGSEDGGAATASPPTSPGQNPFSDHQHLASLSLNPNPFDRADVLHALGHQGGASGGELFTDALKVSGAADALRAAAVDLLNHISSQYVSALDASDASRSRVQVQQQQSTPRHHLQGAHEGAQHVPVEHVLVQVRTLFDNYRRREREAASVLLQASRDEADARRFADEQSAEMRQELRQCEVRLDALRSQKDASDRRATSEISKLQSELSAALAETARKHEEYAQTLAAMSRAQEERGKRADAAAKVELEQALSEEQTRHAGALSEYSSVVSSLKLQLASARDEAAATKDANSALGREVELLRATERAAAARIAGFDVSYFVGARLLSSFTC
jgi:chromosome segregation ATPase